MAAEAFVRADITLSNWRTHPYSRYSFQHVSEFVPLAQVVMPSVAEPPSPGSGLLATATINDRGTALTPVDHLRRSHADHFVAMRDGAVIAEWIAPHAAPERPHLIFSISKSITGLLAGIATADGMLDPDALITTYVPAMKGSGYAGATVRHLLDMTVDIDFDEAYLDAGGAFDRYRRAMLWNPQPSGGEPETMEAFLATLRSKAGAHGERFYYASPNSDLLGLVIERATGIRLNQYLADRLWRPMGACGAAWVSVDRLGTARAAGGICVTARDLARLGQLVINDGRAVDGNQIVAKTWIDDILRNGDRKAWVEGNFADMFADGRYRSCWYNVGDARGTIAAVGIHGQWLWADPKIGVVLAKTSSRPDPSDDDATELEIRMLSQIAALYD